MCASPSDRHWEYLTRAFAFFIYFFLHRTAESSGLSPEKTQDQPQAPDPVHHVPAAGPGEEVPPEAVPLHRRARRVLQLPQPDGDAGQDLVPEQEGESQATPGGGIGKTENGSQAYAPSGVRNFLSSRRAHPGVLRRLPPVPQALSAGVTRRTVCCPRRIQYVPPCLRPGGPGRDRISLPRLTDALQQSQRSSRRHCYKGLFVMT